MESGVLSELKATVARLEARQDSTDQNITELTQAVRELTAIANRWKGGFGAILTLGGLATAIFKIFIWNRHGPG